MRKVICCDESRSSVSTAVLNSVSNRANKRLMRDILYYARKLLKLAQRAQRLNIIEGADSIEEERLIQEEFESIQKEISGLLGE